MTRATVEPSKSGQGLEKTKLVLGFVPLTDCAPLVVAHEKGFFERHGLDVELSREASWATIRDKVAVEALDGGQMLAAMPLAATLGLGGMRTPMVTGLVLNLNGNAVTVTSELAAEMTGPDGAMPHGARDAGAALKRVIAARAAAGKPSLRFAVTFPFSSHNYLLRYWLAASGIEPDRDVRLVVVPPPRMVEHLLDGAIDGFCVGAPWGQRAVDLGVGRIALAGWDIWNNHAEKVFGVTRAWAERNPNTHLALASALLEACRWLDEPSNRPDAARLLATPGYVDVPAELIAAGLAGRLMTAPGAPPLVVPDFHVFHRYAANFPWRSQAIWTLTQMRRWGQLDPACDIAATADAVYRPDICRAASRQLGWAVPAGDFKIEGRHAHAHAFDEAGDAISLGADLFCDGRIFDPTAPQAYLAGFAAEAAPTLKETKP